MKFFLIFILLFSLSCYSIDEKDFYDNYTKVFDVEINENLAEYFYLIETPSILIKYLEINNIELSGHHKITYIDSSTFSIYKSVISFVEKKDSFFKYRITTSISNGNEFDTYFYVNFKNYKAEIFISKYLSNYIPQVAVDKTLRRIRNAFDSSIQKSLAKNLQADVEKFKSIETFLLNFLLNGNPNLSSIGYNYGNNNYLSGIYKDQFVTFVTILFFIIFVYYLIQRKIR